MTSANLAVPLRDAIMATSGITSMLPTWLDTKTVFTRRPVPYEAPFPLIIVGPDISKQDEDGVDDFRPILLRDISIYGLNEKVEHYTTVEALAYAVHDLFHRKPHSLTVATGWNVVAIRAMGPIPAPVDDDQHIGRLVTLEIKLASKASV